MQNLKKNWLVVWKMTWGICQIFTRALESVKNWDFDGILLSKVENLWASNFQRSYVSWQWRMMQNLKRSWLVIPKLTWGIWWILTGALESLKDLGFNGLLATKIYNVRAKKVQKSYLSWHWRVIQNLKKHWLVVWKMTWGIWQISIGWNKWIAHLAKVFTHV